MSRNLRIYYYAVLGAMGGLLGWQLTDLFGFLEGMPVYISDVVRGALLGLSIGAMIGLAEGLFSRSLVRALRAAAIGGVVGLIAGSAALPIAEFIFLTVGGGSLGRMIGWAIFGAVVGLVSSIGARTQMWKGIVGGFIGGAIGALLLEAMLNLLNIPLIGKAGLMILGAAIGVFTALIVVALSRAWIEVRTGKLEGTEFMLDKFMGEKSPAAFIGSNALKSDIALPDPLLAPQHARLKGAGTHMTLQDMSVGDGTYVNGRKIELHQLRDGETIRMGKTELVYHERR